MATLTHPDADTKPMFAQDLEESKSTSELKLIAMYIRIYITK